jgi:hypothetical protein
LRNKFIHVPPLASADYYYLPDEVASILNPSALAKGRVKAEFIVVFVHDPSRNFPKRQHTTCPQHARCTSNPETLEEEGLPAITSYTHP